MRDLSRMLASPGPVNWEIAREIAKAAANADPDGGEASGEMPVDVKSAIRLEELVRVAQTHVAGLTGLAEVGALKVQTVTRSEWAAMTLAGLQPVIEVLAAKLARGDRPGTFDPSLLAGNPLETLSQNPEMLAGMLNSLAPLLFGMQAGMLVGSLAQTTLGQHDLPLPLAGEPRLAFVMANIDQFATDWEVEQLDIYLALAMREVVRCAPRSVSWVREHLINLSSRYVSGYEVQSVAIEEKLEGLLPDDLDMTAFDPSVLLDSMHTAAQDPILLELQRFGCILEGYADAIVVELSNTLAPGNSRVDEALRRHRVERGRSNEFVEKMLGLKLERDHYESGATFCAGVLERAGIDGLNRLWISESMLPTANELAAPGLWLARIDLDLS